MGAAELRKWTAQPLRKPALRRVRPHILTASGSTSPTRRVVLQDPPRARRREGEHDAPVLGVRFNCNKCHDTRSSAGRRTILPDGVVLREVKREEDPKYKGQKIAGPR